jgi:hypothetical protein
MEDCSGLLKAVAHLSLVLMTEEVRLHCNGSVGQSQVAGQT